MRAEAHPGRGRHPMKTEFLDFVEDILDAMDKAEILIADDL